MALDKDIRSDWRLTDQEQYLMRVKLIWGIFNEKNRDHDHCEFCGATFSTFEGDLHHGYCTLDHYYWICEQCFDDFKDFFHWQVER